MACHGVSYYEIERTLGINHTTVSKWARAAGINRGKGGGCVASNNAKRNAEALERVRSELAGRFEVLSLRASRLANLRCCVCGHEFERLVDTRYPTTCPECRRMEIERHAEEREFESKRALMQKLVNILAYEHECPSCGTRFRSSNPYRLYCSESCKNAGKPSGYIERAKSFGVEYDTSVTLDAAIRRFGATCYICGKLCDENDKRWGTFGPDYPTIDHVVPLSKGGTHTWGNVRIACGECNCVVKGARDASEVLKMYLIDI